VADIRGSRRRRRATGRPARSAGDTCTLQFDDATPALPALDRPLKGVIHLWSLDLAPADIAARRRASASVLQLVRALASGAAAGPQPRLWLVTSGAMNVLDGEATAVAQAPLWGLGRAIAVEHAALWAGSSISIPSSRRRPMSCRRSGPPAAKT
jgi:hypothetical protein